MPGALRPRHSAATRFPRNRRIHISGTIPPEKRKDAQDLEHSLNIPRRKE
jgi:hypothetical protein